MHKQQGNYKSLKEEINFDIEQMKITRDNTEMVSPTLSLDRTNNINIETENSFTYKSEKRGRCTMILLNIKGKAFNIVIGPHWYFYLIGCFLFIAFDLFLLHAFWNKLSRVLAWGNIFVLITEITLYTLVFLSDPGIPNRNEGAGEDVVCTTCCSIRKDRPYHCESCDLCITECDHHCIWIGKCVGKNNYVIFYLFVGFTPVYFVVIFFVTGVLNFM